MKIGLEFEGVIHDFRTGEIARWSKIDKAKQNRIKRILYANREAVDPCDRYDALAEVRTLPIENPTPEKLIVALFSEMELASHAFSANGYDIHWFEEPIPVELHEQIRKDFAETDPDGKKDKFTWTIKDREPTQFRGTGNLFRGGGLHINVSSIPPRFAQMVVEDIHAYLQYQRPGFKSHYRTNLLYRTRSIYMDSVVPVPPDHIVEYMSHGFNVQTLADWRKDLSIVVNNPNYDNLYGKDVRFNWAWTLFEKLKHFYELVEIVR